MAHSGIAREVAWVKGLAIGGTVVMAAVLLRVAQLKVVPSPRLTETLGSHDSLSTEHALRGRILDRAGRVLAASTYAWTLYADPALIVRDAAAHAEGEGKAPPIDPLGDAALRLGGALGVSPARFAQTLRNADEKRYIVLDESLDDALVDRVRDLKIDGIGVQLRSERHRCDQEGLARIVGKVGTEQTGLSGAERSWDSRLQPEHGQLRFIRDVRRTPVRVEAGDYRPPEDGEDVRLTIDLNIQSIAEAALEKAVTQTNAGGGRILVVEPATGDILAMADVLRRRPGWNEAVRDELREKDPSLGRNRCASDPYEPGSTFKPFAWAWATQEGYAKPSETIQTPVHGPHRTSFGRTIRDVKYYGPLSWRTVLVKSLNSGMAIVAERMPHAQMQAMVEAFGFGEPVACGIAGETAGLVTTPKAWSVYTQTSVAMGHEIGVTPLQMAQAFGVFCNDGVLVPLRLEGDGPAVGAAARRVPRRVLEPGVVTIAREAMAGVMTEGTGRKAQSEKYRIFGKSGTAQLPKPAGQGKGYFEDRYVSSFIGAAPLDQPRLIVLCVIDDPDKKKGHYGGSIAGPVVRDVLDASLEYLGVAPDQADGGTKRVSAR
ncbi:MAG: penicillin-binding protein 2 [Planctomycetota bacterium]|nr:penicillin-binding protein 2 [Planctomycetota bacterium]MDA1105841.1 penicillin-binding protein 2 [Planctomycetota bacterium]